MVSGARQRTGMNDSHKVAVALLPASVLARQDNTGKRARATWQRPGKSASPTKTLGTFSARVAFLSFR